VLYSTLRFIKLYYKFNLFLRKLINLNLKFVYFLKSYLFYKVFIYIYGGFLNKLLLNSNQIDKLTQHFFPVHANESPNFGWMLCRANFVNVSFIHTYRYHGYTRRHMLPEKSGLSILNFVFCLTFPVLFWRGEKGESRWLCSRLQIPRLCAISVNLFSLFHIYIFSRPRLFVVLSFRPLWPRPFWPLSRLADKIRRKDMEMFI